MLSLEGKDEAFDERGGGKGGASKKGSEQNRFLSDVWASRRPSEKAPLGSMKAKYLLRKERYQERETDRFERPRKQKKEAVLIYPVQ